MFVWGDINWNYYLRERKRVHSTLLVCFLFSASLYAQSSTTLSYHNFEARILLIFPKWSLSNMRKLSWGCPQQQRVTTTSEYHLQVKAKRSQRRRRYQWRFQWPQHHPPWLKTITMRSIMSALRTTPTTLTLVDPHT